MQLEIIMIMWAGIMFPFHARDLLRKEAKEKAKQEAKDGRVPCGDPPPDLSLPYLEDHPRTDVSR